MKNKKLIWIAAAAAGLYLFMRKKPKGQVIVKDIETITREQYEADTKQKAKKEAAKKVLTAAAAAAKKILSKDKQQPFTGKPFFGLQLPSNLNKTAKKVKKTAVKKIGYFY